MAVFQRLALWRDPVRRPGPEAMAVDEWLLENSTIPVLRIYGWAGNWGSIGYFGKIHEAREAVPGVQWVRRWTGGGFVDHRSDWTYTLTAPASEEIRRCRGAESYRMIHSALAASLVEEGIDARLCSSGFETGDNLCFENPVGHDLVDGAGRKLAGGGQRRTRSGLLHQGSVIPGCDPSALEKRAERLATGLADGWEAVSLEVPESEISRKLRERYASNAWTERS